MIKTLVIVNGWNCEKFVTECLDSIINQTNQNFSLVVINDNSTDGTNDILQKYPLPNDVWQKSILMTNKVNEGTAQCRIKGQQVADKYGIDYEVVVWVDMDDLLLPDALERIVKEYEDPDCWLTYGNFVNYSNLSKVFFKPGEMEIGDAPRFESWKYVHLRTHRKDLIYHLTPEDIGAEHYKAYPDINMLYCMLELAGKDHIRCVYDPVYVYRDHHPNTCINRFTWSARQAEKELTKKTQPKIPLKEL